MTANESIALLHAATAGLGITCLPAHMCRDTLTAGTLQRVLPAWTAGHVTTTLVMPHRRGLLPGVRVTVEFLVTCLGGA
jgi:DNA-binding transcriptional LysR family regulator